MRTGKLFIFIFVMWFFPCKPTNAQNPSNPNKAKTLSFNISSGYTHFTFEEDGQQTIVDHNNKWKNTTNFNGFIGYHFNENWMLGLNFSQTNAFARTNGIIATSRIDTLYGHLEDNISLSTFGLALEKNLWATDHFNLAFIIGLDYFYYINTGQYIVDKFTLDGADIGTRLGFVFNASLDNKLSLNLSAQYQVARLNNPTYSAVNQLIPVVVDSQNLTRVELNIGLRYDLFTKRQYKKKVKTDSDDYVPNSRFD